MVQQTSEEDGDVCSSSPSSYYNRPVFPAAHVNGADLAALNGAKISLLPLQGLFSCQIKLLPVYSQINKEADLHSCCGF